MPERPAPLEGPPWSAQSPRFASAHQTYDTANGGGISQISHRLLMSELAVAVPNMLETHSRANMLRNAVRDGALRAQ